MSICSRAGAGSKFTGSGFEVRYRFELGVHKFVSKPVELQIILIKPLVKFK